MHGLFSFDCKFRAGSDTTLSLDLLAMTGETMFSLDTGICGSRSVEDLLQCSLLVA
jgi:hypothetical protein